MLKRFFLAASLLIFWTPSVVNACSCYMNRGKCDQTWNHGKVIFAATVTRQLIPTDGFSRRVFELSVSESFLGPATAGQDIKIYTGAGGGDCGYPFEIGTSYLVYAHLVGDRLVATICSSTTPAAQATHILRQLRALQKGESGAALFGVVRRLRFDFTGQPAVEITPLENTRVRVIGSNEFEQSTTTDQEGVYSFPTLPAAQYRIEVDPSPPEMSNWHMNRGEPVTVEIGPITKITGCSMALSFASEASIKGRVIDEYEHSLAGSITLEPADEKGAAAARRLGGLISSTTDTGEFLLLLSVPGRYRLVYRPKAGVAPPVSSEVIQVNYGERADFRFKVPSVRQ